MLIPHFAYDRNLIVHILLITKLQMDRRCDMDVPSIMPLQADSTASILILLFQMQVDYLRPM